MSIFARSSSLTQPWMVGRKKVTRLSKGAYWIKEEKQFPTNDPTTGWTDKSRRTGLIAVKLGMMADMDEWGQVRPLTVLQIKDCQVIQQKTTETDGYTSLQLGAGTKKLKRVRKAQMGHFAKADVDPKRNLQEFRVTPDALIPVGTELVARHFVPGQLVDVCGISKGKGFQGGMKRWGFGGLFATHGVSVSHRSLGATGARQDPGKVWKGKKMAGHMGSDRITTQNLRVYQVDSDTNTVCVVGGVPGAPGSYIRITDGIRYKFDKPPPFPTHYPAEGENTMLRYSFPKPKPAIEDPEEENKSWWETVSTKLPIRLSESAEQAWEAARKQYREDLERGFIGRVIREKFPEVLPQAEDVAEWEERLRSEEKLKEQRRVTKLMKQPKPSGKVVAARAAAAFEKKTLENQETSNNNQ